MKVLTKIFSSLVIALIMSAGFASAIQSVEAQTSFVPNLTMNGFHSFFDRHPRMRKAAKAAALGAGIGTGLGLITGAGVVGGAAAGAGRGAGCSLVRTSKTWKKAKNKVIGSHSDKHDRSETNRDRHNRQ